ncbi:terminase large subunit domain-containing protein [Agrobacterium sp. MCAB5]|uniref:terminase large subunit domain-containing protein n=1 Tax=Agrobacterium sp. MCAB5 TaxID=3233042 RepID=UPI003F8E6A5F
MRGTGWFLRALLRVVITILLTLCAPVCEFFEGAIRMLMARDLARALSPVVMAQDCGIQPDPWQATLLDQNPRRALLLCSRQSGKSTVAALIVIYAVLFVPAAQIVVVSPTQRQSNELFRTIIKFLDRLPGAPRLVSESTQRAEFSNGSRILSLPGTEKTIRGIAGVDLVVIDEASRVADELLTAVRPMMATKPDARLVALTTPAGKRGWFYEAWVNGDPSWERVKVPASECPRISPEYLAEELKALGAIKFSEEYNLEFHDPEEAVFPLAIIEAAFTHEVRALW